MSNSEWPSLSVIIVSYNRRDDLRVALRSVREQDYPGNLETVVVDNGSTDGTREAYESGELGVISFYQSDVNLGASVARNIALRIATGDLLVFMDSDAELLHRDDLRQLVERLLADPQLAGIAPAIYLDRNATQPWMLGGYLLRGLFSDMQRMVSDFSDPHFLSTCCSVWKRQPVMEAGGFDPLFPYGYEDADLSMRICDNGHVLAVASEIAVQHHISATGRVRPWATWAHKLYNEKSRNRLCLIRFGLKRYLREWAWLWTYDGRWMRGGVFTGTGTSRWTVAWLMSWVPLTVLLSYPRLRWRYSRKRNWIAEAPYSPSRGSANKDSTHGRTGTPACP